MEPINEGRRRSSRDRRRLAESSRSEQATHPVRQLAARRYASLKGRLAAYTILAGGITLIVWRFTHWAVWRIDPIGAYRVMPDLRGAVRTPPPENLAPGFATQTEPAAWIDPVGLAVGLILGLLITWVYARYFEGL